MLDNIYIQTIDEFNYTSSVNFFNKEVGIVNGVLCLPGFEIMFYNFDKIIKSKTITDEGTLLSNNLELKVDISNKIKEESKVYLDNFLTQLDINTGSGHIYEFMFNSLAKDMLLKNRELYLPLKSDYEIVKNKLSHINKKIISINGRNLIGDRSSRNNSFFDLIKLLIQQDYFVVNCTIPNPIFSDVFSSDSYLEISEKELFSYSMTISYFLNSDCLISVSDSGGITNHICTKSNIILYGPGGWVDNPKFGADGKSLYEISKDIKPTYMTNDFKEIVNILKTLNRPENISFFDESKIANI